MPQVAGHMFKAYLPGEYCTLDNCQGVQSLVELCDLADVAKYGDQRIAHAGGLTHAEITEMKEAKKRLRENMEKVFPK